MAEKYVRRQRDSGEVCRRSDRGVQGRDGIASGFGSEPLLVCSGEGWVDR